MSELTPAQKNAEWLAKILAGEYARDSARVEEAAAKRAAQQYPFQGQAFKPTSETCQPQLSTPSWGAHSRWLGK